MIAVATLVMALIQIGAIVSLARVAARSSELVATVQQDIRPLIARANGDRRRGVEDRGARDRAGPEDRPARDRPRPAASTRRRAVVQQAIITPAREGMALVAALKAGLAALRGLRDLRGRPGAVEDEDALFIG